MAANQLAQLLAEYENADLAVPGEVFPAPERDLNSILSVAGARLNDKLEGGISGLLNAVMAPGAALQGEYNQRPIFEDGSVGMFDPRMEEDVANLAGLISLGVAPIPRPSGSLSMGASSGAGGLIRDGYVGSHRAPPLEKGATLNDPRMVFGDDIFSPQAQQYFGTGNKVMDAESIAVIKSAMDNPDALVSIYRAVPKDVPNSINPGDWVTISRSYANDHGVSSLGGDFNIMETKVPARQLSTDGNSIHEWGWWPE